MSLPNGPYTIQTKSGSFVRAPQTAGPLTIDQATPTVFTFTAVPAGGHTHTLKASNLFVQLGNDEKIALGNNQDKWFITQAGSYWSIAQAGNEHQLWTVNGVNINLQNGDPDQPGTAQQWRIQPRDS